MPASVWKGHVTFGLVSIPVRLVKAAQAERIRMHHLDRKTGSRVRQRFVPAAETEPEPQTPEKPETAHFVSHAAGAAAKRTAVERELPRSELVKGVEVEKGRYVEIEPEEIERAAPKNSDDMPILEFVKFEEIDPIYLENSYFVTPDGGGEKPYALLFAALKETGYAAIGELVMHRREHVVTLRTDGKGIVLHTLFYPDEVRLQARAEAGLKLVTPKERELAVKLVEALEGKFEPAKFRDKYRERMKAIIEEKRESAAITTAPPEVEKPGKVVDIMDALRSSLAKVKKPPEKATKARSKRKAS